MIPVNFFKEKRREKIDREKDRIIEGYFQKRKKKATKAPAGSKLIDINSITEEKISRIKFVSYRDFVEFALRKVEKSNRFCQKNGGHEIKIHKVERVDGKEGFEVGGKVFPKYTFQLGKSDNPRFKMLVLAGTHGGESRLAGVMLEAALQLALPGKERCRLLEEGTVLFDPVVDPAGFNNQTRGAVTREGMAVNAPLVGGGIFQPGLENPWGLGDRNSAQGRNSIEAQDILTLSNKNHYRKILGGRASWVYDAHETCEFTQFPDLVFTYGGILLIPHVYLPEEKLAYLNLLEPCVGGWRKLKAFFNDLSPLGEPLYREQFLWHDPTIEKIKKIRERIRELGQRTMEEKFDRAFLFIPQVERDIRVDESIYIGGMMFRIPRILLGPDVLGYEGLTSETFQQDLMVRAKQTLACLEAQLQVVGLGLRGEEDDLSSY